MTVESILTNSTDTATEILLEIGQIGKWLQAIGLIVIIWLIFYIINWVYHIKRIKKLKRIEEKLSTLENKLDKALKKKSTS